MILWSMIIIVVCLPTISFAIPSANVTLITNDTFLQTLYNTANSLTQGNVKTFGNYQVLVEGGGYGNVWLETQPMGGEMYGQYDMAVAKNNQMIFIDYQLSNGRLPGMITNNTPLTVSYGWFQGINIAPTALNVYYLLGKDTTYLQSVYNALQKQDNYLWNYRDSDHDGCLEQWCVWDTGEDGSPRLSGFPNSYGGESAA